MPPLDFSRPVTSETEYNRALLHPAVHRILAKYGVLPRDEEERYAMATCPLGLAVATSPAMRDDPAAQASLLAEIATLAHSEPISLRRGDLDYERFDRIEADGDVDARRPEWAASVPLYGRFDLALQGPGSGNPYLDVSLSARIDGPGGSTTVDGFHDGGDRYRIRFMPLKPGSYSFTTSSNAAALDGHTGSFEVGAAAEGSHGPVRADGFHFRHDDGTMYRPIGTTAYGWIHQSATSRDETIETLRASGFTKLRMTVTPKWFAYNESEPEISPFQRSSDGASDFSRPEPAFWNELETRIGQLGDLGIEVDLILFHPYDKWGFEDMGVAADDRYVRYAVARLGSFANVWWSLANEYDVMVMKSMEDWRRIGELIAASDPAGHLRSIHHCIEPYDHAEPWVTHVSIQSMDVANASPWRAAWGKPVVIDECAYEGDLLYVWGNSSAEDLTRRHWDAAVRGAYAGHGETIMAADGRLWWSHGGALLGESERRIAFLRDVMADGPAHGWEPLNEWWPYPSAGVDGQYIVAYLGPTQPHHHLFVLDPHVTYDVDVIDTWNMSVTRVAESVSGRIDVPLPAAPYVAVRFTAAG